MERRGFIKGLAALVGGIVLKEAIPFGRVWSFPKNIACVNSSTDPRTIQGETNAALHVLNLELESPYLPQGMIVNYDRKFIQELKARLPFNRMTGPVMALPEGRNI